MTLPIVTGGVRLSRSTRPVERPPADHRVTHVACALDQADGCDLVLGISADHRFGAVDHHLVPIEHDVYEATGSSA